MFDFPRTLHQLYFFQKDAVFYAADLDKASTVEFSAVMVDILKLAETQTSETIVQTLKDSYPEADIFEAFERFEELEKEGLLFNRGENITEILALESEHRKLLVVIPNITPELFYCHTLSRIVYIMRFGLFEEYPMRLIPSFRMLALVLLCVNVSPVLAKAPATEKIVFTSARDGNREVYIMNPDGSE